ncbi:MAG: glycosyltransferase family 4 protein [Caldilineaceae bacterium]|nr:glycosyltransferase family 4 protein [Caldilineaceae bacterium]
MSRPSVVHITTIDLSLRLLLLNQLRSIQAGGYEVSCISAPGPNVPEIEAAGFQHFAVPMTRNFTPLSDLRSLATLVTIMRRERFCVVHTHTPKPGLLGQLAARMAGVPVVVNTLHGFYFHDNMPSFWRQFYIATEKIAARCSDMILSQNREDMDTAVNEGICAPGKLAYLGNGIDIRRFHRQHLSQAQIDETGRGLGLPRGAPVVGFVGRLVAEKGILEMFRAARIVLDHHPAARFLIIGPYDREKIDALSPQSADEFGIAASCVFTGMRQDMPELFALMDVFVLPSHREGFPRSPMEASAMGVPSIVTDIRGCREAVIDEQNGLLVPLGDVDALAAAILRLLDNPADAARMGATGREMAVERFDEQQVFAKVKSTYARLLEQKGLAADVGASRLPVER